MEKLKLNQLLICAGILGSLLTVCAAVDTLTVNQTIRDGEIIVSANGNFELGYFSPNNSNNRFLGIWSKTISPRQFMWISNAGNPINDTSGVLKLSGDGRLLLLRSGDIVIWASGFPDSNIIRPVAQLLDTGNLVLRDDQENVIWQSNPDCDVCVRSGICGPGGTCNSNNSPVCSCLAGFEPTSPDEWRLTNWSRGCRRIEPLDCVKDAFRKISGIKLPDTRGSWYNVSMTLEECQTACQRNCSCTAYAIRDIQSGCLLWFGDLEDMRENGGGRELYVTLTASELEELCYGIDPCTRCRGVGRTNCGAITIDKKQDPLAVQCDYPVGVDKWSFSVSNPCNDMRCHVLILIPYPQVSVFGTARAKEA